MKLKENSLVKMLVLCLICTFFWGAGYPILKMSYAYWGVGGSDVPGKLLYASLRFIPAGLILLAVSSLKKKKLSVPDKKAMPWVALLGVCQTALQYGLLYIGMAFTSGTKSSVLNQVCIFIMVLLTPVFFRGEKLTLRKIVGCVAGFAGIVVMNLSGLSFKMELGDVIVIASSCCAAAGYLISKGMPGDSDALTSTAWQQITGGVILLILGLATGGKIAAPNLPGILCLIFQVAAAAIAYSLWFYLLKAYDASTVSVSKFLTPVFGVLFSGLLLGEEIFTLTNFAALALVCAGVIVVNLKKKV